MVKLLNKIPSRKFYKEALVDYLSLYKTLLKGISCNLSRKYTYKYSTLSKGSIEMCKMTLLNHSKNYWLWLLLCIIFNTQEQVSYMKHHKDFVFTSCWHQLFNIITLHRALVKLYAYIMVRLH